MATIQHSNNVRINAKGEITIPWYTFVNAHPDEVWGIICKKARTRRRSSNSTNKGVKLYV